MINYGVRLANYLRGGVLFAATVTLAAGLATFMPDEAALVVAALFVFLVGIGMFRRFFQGREKIAFAVAGLNISAGLAGLYTAPYVSVGFRPLFLPAFVVAIIFVAYLGYALFTAEPGNSDDHPSADL
jgi:hypothetical protein